MHSLRCLDFHRSMASLMISVTLLDVVFVSFSSVLFSSSFMRSEMTFCSCSVSFLFFLDAFGSLVKRFLVYDMVSSCVVCRGSVALAVSKLQINSCAFLAENNLANALSCLPGLGLVISAFEWPVLQVVRYVLPLALGELSGMMYTLGMESSARPANRSTCRKKPGESRG